MTIPTLLLSLAPLFSAGQGASRVPNEVFAPASGDLVLVVDAAGESDSMLTVVEEYARLTNQPVVVDAMSRDYLANLPTGVQQDVVVPPAGVQSFVEGLLANYGCGLVVRPGAPQSIQIHTPRSEVRNWSREGALQVDESELGAWSDYPATLIRCTIQLEAEDVRQVANSLRVETLDNTRQLIVSVGTGRALVVVGGGTWVGKIVATVRAADAGMEASRQPEFGRIALSHAVAVDAAPIVQELLDAANGHRNGPQQQGPMPAVRVRVLADERTNSVLVVGSADDLAAARELIATLDVPVSAR